MIPEPCSQPAALDPSLGWVLNQPPLVAEIIDGEVMIINLDTGVYYNATGAAAVAWPWLIAGASIADVARATARHYALEAQAIAGDLAAFAARLETEAIVRRERATPALEACAPGPGLAPPYPGFGLERFDDMRALLVVDPVHEVGDSGWPPRAASAPKTP